ncbi:MAG: fibronectin/fibrinogen-binding protein [Lachnospiraceae bacterium]|nr:fibronectin/fibrinogen-binding protein [Lachnospiraceae bacterium]
MAFDGIVIANLVHELNTYLIDGRISKIAQPENDELLFTIKTKEYGNKRLSISANASLPFLYLTEENKPGPMQAPAFCMLLRKHISGGRITAVSQPGLERIIHIQIEHLNEMGDLCHKELIVELMGKHSNIIFVDDRGVIIDSIKRISAATSSLREVLPGIPYEIANTQNDKKNPLAEDLEGFIRTIRNRPTTVSKAIYMSYSGISPLMAHEFCYRVNIDGDLPIQALSDITMIDLGTAFTSEMKRISEGEFSPCIVYKDSEPVEYSAISLHMYEDLNVVSFESISEVLFSYFNEKEKYTRIRQKSTDLRHVVNTALERTSKKYDLQLKQYRDAEKKEKYKLYGELLQVYGYQVESGAKFAVCPNYYDEDNEIKIPLDETISALDNSKKYFAKYGKLKRTQEALDELLEETKMQIDHLESIQNSLDIAVSVEDLNEIRNELMDYGFIKKSYGKKNKSPKSKPFHYRSSDGFDIFVGKNNYQNDELTFKIATGNDWWFHAKGMPGSHVIVKTNGEELPDRVFEEAGRLAGYYSKGRDAEKLEIDYLQKKNVKKPNKANPGFVVYYTNYSLTIHPGLEGLTLIES